jgi:hypothetical protein
MVQAGTGGMEKAGGGTVEMMGGAAGGASAPVSVKAEFTLGFLTYAMPQLVVNGGSSVTETLSLARNAVVLAPFPVTVRAGRAQWSRCGDVARVRTADISGGSQTRTSLVVDFGMLRTVNAVAVLNSLTRQVLQVKVWTGMGFAEHAQVNADVPEVITSSSGTLTGFADAIVPFPSEVKTERLQIDLVGGGDEQALGQEVLVQLPDDPADLELRINDGPPVWAAPGAAVENVAGWQAADGGLVSQTVELSQALTALLGDPTADVSQKAELRLVLSARVPGALALELPPKDLWKIEHLAQITQGFPDGARELQFPEEGLIPVALPLPPWAQAGASQILLTEVQLTVAANVPPERAIPPLGPAAEMTTAEGVSVPFAELLLDPDHAACVALTPDTDLVALSAVRLPLQVAPGGAELRVLLMTPDTAGEPGSPLETGASQPVSLEESSGSQEAWTTFTFPQPIALDAPLPLAGILVTRGTVRLALGRIPAADAPVQGAGEVWLGPPAGPWQRLPAVGVLDRMRGRIRMVGTASRDKPVAPIRLTLHGASDGEVQVVPTPKGVAATIGPPAGLAVGADGTAGLDVVSLAGGAVTIRGVRTRVQLVPDPTI